ncbi:DUF1593 domain-containing protein [Pelagicoccus sp. SDUM812002]|uniref:DUF1593 domain-containing protein n=1 Tax=Pelagicoccus sp. SDUM812002 TaxID=3041266 RepID=UPI00280F5559|nr:DUF1593 domain-containing protein [Pelagicoccus sp. SDUM812002]MDQ8187653.1 DUF1593 domain-containing protein [Pelagicoccus sp. SDUM812002]
MKAHRYGAILFAILLSSPPTFAADSEPRHRVIVSTDIGGTDFDDFQSMVHLLLYADELEIEGLISSPYGPGRKEDILSVIDHYETDYPKLRTWSEHYPSPEFLRSITKQGETERAPYAGVRRSTEGSSWIVERARFLDSRPLHVLVWGGLEDVAQALHDAPEILPKLKVHYIGGPNKKWSPDAYHYIASEHPELFMIESNSTYRGWFVGGAQKGDLSTHQFAEAHAAGHGALGDFFAGGISFHDQVRKEVKMGDTPTVAWLLQGDPDKPYQGGWGGRFVRAWTRPYSRFERMTTEADEIEFCAIMELALPLGSDAPKTPSLHMKVENQMLVGHLPGDGTVRFRFCPKTPKTYSYEIVGNDPSLDGKKGQVTAVLPSPDVALEPDEHWPNWWTDDPSPPVAEGAHHGARTVSQWRESFMLDFATRLERCRNAKTK